MSLQAGLAVGLLGFILSSARRLTLDKAKINPLGARQGRM